jgi:hypothetical protein
MPLIHIHSSVKYQVPDTQTEPRIERQCSSFLVYLRANLAVKRLIKMSIIEERNRKNTKVCNNKNVNIRNGFKTLYVCKMNLRLNSL